jgi:hypothetical protein
MKEIITTSIFLFLFPTLVNSQMPVSELGRLTHLRQLKDGILLVQLPNRDKKIAKLKEIGLSKRAKTEAAEVQLERDGIIEGFEKEFKFCDVLYFEREHTREILRGNYKNVFDSIFEHVSDFPETVEVYIAQYGVGHPNGEVSSYNGVGIQIRHVHNGQLETINHDYFYKRSKVGLIIGKKKAVIKGIKNLNYNLNKVPVEKY